MEKRARLKLRKRRRKSLKTLDALRMFVNVNSISACKRLLEKLEQCAISSNKSWKLSVKKNGGTGEVEGSVGGVK